jgi:CelD/BcsL family acetyltransferase involved in cellulose biosynthesis
LLKQADERKTGQVATSRADFEQEIAFKGIAAPVVRVLTWRQVGTPEIAAAWDALVLQASEPNVFNERWYLHPALEQFDRAENVRLFTLWSGEPGQSNMLALMPLAAEKSYGRWPVPHWQNWLHPNAFLGTPLVRKGYETAFWQTLISHIDNEPGKALFLHINGMTDGGDIQQALQALCAAQSRRSAVVHSTQRAFLQSDSSPAAYFEDAVRGKKRKELRRQKNRLSEEGTLTFHRSDGASGLADWTQEFLTLERQGWKGNNGSALDCADDTRNLFCTALAGAAQNGQLELLDLRLDGKPLAMLVNFLAAPGSFSYKTAFDEEFSRFSPGVLLQIENLALLEREGVAWCDSCAAQDHPMIDGLWTGRRTIARYSVAIGGSGRRSLFSALLRAELLRSRPRKSTKSEQEEGAP